MICNGPDKHHNANASRRYYEDWEDACKALNALQAELTALSAAIGTNDYLDPPDGGGPGLIEQVRRMRADVLSQHADIIRLARELATIAEKIRCSPGCYSISHCRRCTSPPWAFTHAAVNSKMHAFEPDKCNCPRGELLAKLGELK